jgi:hypothetical protein
MRSSQTTTFADLPGDVFGSSSETELADLPADVFGPQRMAAPQRESGPFKAEAIADLPRDVFGAPETRKQPAAEIARSGSGLGGSRRLDQPRLGHAFELTRDALCAWMNVLTGPAVVDVTFRGNATTPDRTARATGVESFH